MLKNKYAHVTLIAILAAFLSYSIVYACSPVEPIILIRCSNIEIIVSPNTGPTEGESYKDMQERWVKETMNNLLAIVPECEEDLTPVLDSFKQEVTVWLDYESKRGTFLDRDLILEPYSANRDFQLQKDKKSLLSCGYAEYTHIGNWLIIFETGRPYCFTYWYSHGGMCPVIVLSLGGFLLYLLTNLSFTTLPYLAGWLIASGTIIYTWWMVLKNRPVTKGWKSFVISAIIFALALFLIVPPFWIFGQVIGWVLVFGLIVLWYKQRKGVSK